VAVTVEIDVSVVVLTEAPVVIVVVVVCVDPTPPGVVVTVLVIVWMLVGHVAGEFVVVVVAVLCPRRQEQTELAWTVLKMYVESVLGSPAMLVCLDARYSEQDGDARAEMDSAT